MRGHLFRIRLTAVSLHSRALKATWLVLCLYLQSAFLCSAMATSTGELIEISTGDDYPPYVDSKRPKGGIATEVVSEVVAKMGGIPKVTVLPWARGYKLMLKGDFIATFPYIRTESRESEVLFSEPLFSIASHVFVVADSAFKFRNLGDLAGRTTCNYVGSALPSSMQQLIKDRLVKLNETTSLSTCFKLLELGRVDFVTVNSLAGATIACEQFRGTRKVLISERPVEVLDLHLVVDIDSPKSRSFLEGFNSELQRFKATKVYQSLKAKASSPISPEPAVQGFKKIACEEIR
jgi:polar amino acid transport system substrate-binding protein